MKKIKLIGAFLFLSLFIFRCSYHNEVISEINKCLNQNKFEISFEAIGEDFDSLMIFHPYSNIEKIENQLNLDLKKIKKTGIEMRDDISVFAFLKNREVVDYTEVFAKYQTQVNSFKIYPKNYLFKLQKGEGSKSKLIYIKE